MSPRATLELAAVLLTAALQYVFYDLLSGRGPFIVATGLAWAAYFVVRIRQSKDNLDAFGLSTKGLRKSAEAASVVFLFGLALCLAIGAARHTLRFGPHMLILALAYPVWGLAQQLLVQAMHVRVLFTYDSHGRILRINEPGGGGPAPRLYLGRTKTGCLWRFRADLPEDLVGELERSEHTEDFVRLLAARAPVAAVHEGPAYAFPADLAAPQEASALTPSDADRLRGGFEKLIPELGEWQPFLALLERGRAVSVCRSVRITPEAHEAGVETLPGHRGKGHAKRVVAAWARAVRSLGAVPLYSTSWQNTASQALATSLRLVRYGVDFHVS